MQKERLRVIIILILIYTYTHKQFLQVCLFYEYYKFHKLISFVFID